MTKIEQKIPEGWSFKKLGELFFKSQKKNIEEKNIPVLTNSAVKGVVPQNEYFDREIVSEENLSNYYYVECGDFIYNPRISKTAPAGPIKRNRFTKPGCVSPLYTVFKIASNVSEEFYENYFESNLWAYEAYKVANYGARSDRMNITDKDFFNIKLPFPPLPEQEKIARILSCWDDGIEKLLALIEKKKIQKKALMQQLLTGKHRLKGFTSPWHEVKLGDIATIAAGTSKAQYIDKKGDYFVVDMGAVSNEATLIAKKRTSYYEDFLNVNDIIMPKDDIGGGNIIGKCIIVSENRKYILGDHVFKLVIKNNFPLFICLKINSFEINKYMKRCATGSAQLGLSKKDVSKCLLYIPSDIAEQKVIAEILSKADEEIELLNKKLEVFKQEKKALMQQLLTGKIRVKVN